MSDEEYVDPTFNPPSPRIDAVEDDEEELDVQCYDQKMDCSVGISYDRLCHCSWLDPT